MIELTKLNGTTVLINPLQIEYIEIMPESRIIMMNGKFHIVSEDKDFIIEEVKKYYQSIFQSK